MGQSGGEERAKFERNQTHLYGKKLRRVSVTPVVQRVEAWMFFSLTFGSRSNGSLPGIVCWSFFSAVFSSAMKWLVGVLLVLVGLTLGTTGMHLIRMSELKKKDGHDKSYVYYVCGMPYHKRSRRSFCRAHLFSSVPTVCS